MKRILIIEDQNYSPITVIAGDTCGESVQCEYEEFQLPTELEIHHHAHYSEFSDAFEEGANWLLNKLKGE